jgi:hypothetical protein
VHCSLAHIEAFGKPHRLGSVTAFLNENKYNYSSSQCAFFLNCMWNPRVSGSGNAKLSTAFDVIRKFILLFAWYMPEVGFIGTAVSKRFHRCAIVLICVPGAPRNMDRAI